MTSPASPSPRALRIRDIVRDAGYVPGFVAQGSVQFKAEGKIYLIPDEKDEAFIRIIHQQFRLVKNEEERPVLEAAALQANTVTKVAKIYVAKDQVWAVAELFCWPVDRLAAVLIDSITVVDYAVLQFTKRLQAPAGRT